MKILHLNEHLSWSGGIETYLLSLVPRLEALGHQQSLLYAGGDAGLMAGSRRLPLLARSEAAARRECYKSVTDILAEERPDLVHVHNIRNTGALAACLDAVPTVLHGHDYRYLCPASTFFFRRHETICERTCGPGCFVATVGGRCMSLRPPYAWTYYAAVRFAAANAGRFFRVVANSGYMRDRFIQAGFPTAKVDVLPYFCPVEPLSGHRTVPARPTLLWLGRARPNKGYRYFVEALGRLPEQVQGILIGDFSAQAAADVRRLADAGGCQNRVEIRPWSSREAIDGVFAAATIVVVPSVWAEPLGIVGLESLARGVPVVASDVGGVREWLHEGRTGRLVPPKDSAAIAAAVSDILALPDQGRGLGENGLTLIREKFSVQGHVDELLELYEAACASEYQAA